MTTAHAATAPAELLNRRSVKKIDINDGRIRCGWAARDPILAAYHDREWGQSIRTDAGHLKRMALEIFQCGLSWKIVLVKTPALVSAFHAFDPKRVASMSAKDVDRLCQNPDIIRNRRKIEATISNSRVFLSLAEQHGSYSKWLKALPAGTADDVAALYRTFKTTFSFMGPETTKCYLMGCGKIPPHHEPACFMA